MIRISGLELRTAVQMLGGYLDKPVVFTGPPGGAVTFETPRAVTLEDVPRLLRGLVESQGYEFLSDTATRLYRVQPRQIERPAGARAAQPARGVQLYVIHLEHARAGDVAATVNALYGRGNGVNEQGRRSTLADELRQNQVPALETSTGSSRTGTAVATSASLTGDVTIVPDSRANTLLVRANDADFALIQAAVRQIDVRPLQVLIEVVIAEVRRDRNLDVGVDVSVGDQRMRHTENTTIGGEVDGAGSPGLGDFVLRVMGIAGIDVDATLRATVGQGRINILSRPAVVTANNEEAEIVVGSQRPFVQVARALATETSVRDQIVQYKDVGTKLLVRPTISADGLVQLDVLQEVSSASGEVQFNAPVISTRSVQTQLFVRDGQTVVLGGLVDRQKDVSSSGIPVLSSIPWIGGLFGRSSRRTIETELFLFLTPYVIRTDDDAQRLTEPRQARAREIAP